MTIKYHTSRPELNDGSVGNGRSAMIDGAKEVVTEYSMLPEVVAEVVNMTTEGPIQGGEEKILAETTEVERQEGEIKERDGQNMTALAEDSFKEVRDDEAGTRDRTDLDEKDEKEAALPATVEYKCAESSGKPYGRELKGTPVTMTRPLLQLAESVEVEKKRLDELEHKLEKRVTTRLEAQSSGPPYTAQILNAMIAENERDIAAVQKALRMRQRLEEREAKLARLGAGLHDRSYLDAQAAEHERRELEANKRYSVRMEALKRKEELKEDEQARGYVQGTNQITRESDRGLMSLLADNDHDIAIAHGVIRNGRTVQEQGAELGWIEARVAMRNRQIVNAYSSDSTVETWKADRLSLGYIKTRLGETRRLRLMIYRRLREYMQSNGTAAASSLLRALSEVPLCTSSQMRLKNALVGSIQQHDTETGSRYEGCGSGGVANFATTSVSQAGHLMQYLPRHSTDHPNCLYTTNSTSFSRSQASEHVRAISSVSHRPGFYPRTSRMPSLILGEQGRSLPRHAMFLPQPPVFLGPVQHQDSSFISNGVNYTDQDMRVKVEDRWDEEDKRRAELLGGFPVFPINTRPAPADPNGEDHEVNYVPNQLDEEQAIDGDIQVKEKAHRVTQKPELPGARPNSRTDAGAFVCDPNWGVRKVIDPIDKNDLEQAVTAELLAESTKLDFIQAQPPHPEIIDSTTRVIMLVILSYTMLWFYTYWKLSQQIYLAPTLIFVGFRVFMDLLDLYHRVHQFWMCENAKLIALALVSINVVLYVSTILLTTWDGPLCALCTVWLVPFAIDLLGWCSNGYVSFEKWCPRRIRLMQGPFTEKILDHRRTLRLASFGINMNRVALFIFWRRLLSIVYYALTYVAFFSRQESWFAKGTALVISMYLRSEQFPLPRQLEEADTMFHLRQREYDFTRESGRIRCPSIKECYAQQCATFREGCRKYSHLLKIIGRFIIFAVMMTIIITIIRI